ncbi:hypothetical protein MUK42_36458 [Musa troglodytarum]|uniref:Uncharacterized protein n=1 Tax=Musa troglodytarum TaxID=320322 RepID=A0A9E7GMW0_9LILI|nr:hypothetical protein MUK42_36458 [Musa troglodytarum]
MEASLSRRGASAAHQLGHARRRRPSWWPSAIRSTATPAHASYAFNSTNFAPRRRPPAPKAISLKETQLIGQVAIQREDNISDSCGQIHFVSAKEDTVEVSKSKDSSILSEQSEHQDHDAGNYEDKLSGDSEQPTFLASVSSDMSNFVKMVDSSEGFHEHILENLDMQLKLLETDIENFLRSQSLKEETKQKQMNEKLEKLSEILKDVLSIRERIASMVETRVDDGN